MNVATACAGTRIGTTLSRVVHMHVLLQNMSFNVQMTIAQANAQATLFQDAFVPALSAIHRVSRRRFTTSRLTPRRFPETNY